MELCDIFLLDSSGVKLSLGGCTEQVVVYSILGKLST